MVKKNSKRKLGKIITLIVVLVLVLAIGGYFGYKQFFLEKKQSNPVGMAVEAQIGDFPSEEQGTFAGMLKETYYKEQLDDVIVLFVSEKIPGLAIIYYPKEKRLMAGRPLMIASDISLFDGQKHEIKYAFKKDGPQGLFYDGKLVAQGEFKEPSSLTGMATGAQINYVAEEFEQVDIN